MSVGFNIKVKDKQLQRALKKAVRATGNLSPAMRAIGEHLLRSTEENFAKESDPDGHRWKPLKVLSYALGYSMRKKKPTHTKAGKLTAAFSKYLAGRKILTESGELRGSIKYSADSRSVAIGTPKVYGAIHQIGGKAGRGRKVAIPARPFLGVGADDRSEIFDILKNHVQAAISG